MPRWVFRNVGNKTLISPVKNRIFCQKRPNLARNWHFCQALPAHLPRCWWVGWWLWRVGCIWQDTYLLYHRGTKVWTFQDAGFTAQITFARSGFKLLFAMPMSTVQCTYLFCSIFVLCSLLQQFFFFKIVNSFREIPFPRHSKNLETIPKLSIWEPQCQLCSLRM